jgi:outer membrane protein TolC
MLVPKGGPLWLAETLCFTCPLDRARTAAGDALFAAAQLLPEAEHGLALARASHAAGQSSLFVVLDAQERLLAARRRQAAAQREAAAAAALERALGCRAPRVMPQPDAD